MNSFDKFWKEERKRIPKSGNVLETMIGGTARRAYIAGLRLAAEIAAASDLSRIRIIEKIEAEATRIDTENRQ